MQLKGLKGQCWQSQCEGCLALDCVICHCQVCVAKLVLQLCSVHHVSLVNSVQSSIALHCSYLPADFMHITHVYSDGGCQRTSLCIAAELSYSCHYP